MSELTAFLEALKGLSPYLGAFALLLVGWLAWLKHLESKADRKVQAKKESELSKLSEDVESNSKKTLALTTAVRNIERENEVMLATLVDHDNKAESRFTRQVDVLVQIHEQLVRLNAANATVINPDNAKRIIQYQWNWCRDEVARLSTNSIRNNSFRGREDIVARKVYDAWRKAAENSLQSLLRLDGLQYPYKHLYTNHLSVIWNLAWGWAVPVYHSAHGDETFDSRLVDLEGRIKALFDQVITLHYELVEDIDHGLFYADAREQKNVTVVNNMQAPLDMGNQLKGFKVGTTDKIQKTPELREILSRAIQADRAEGSGASRAKSSPEIPKAG